MKKLASSITAVVMLFAATAFAAPPATPDRAPLWMGPPIEVKGRVHKPQPILLFSRARFEYRPRKTQQRSFVRRIQKTARSSRF